MSSKRATLTGGAATPVVRGFTDTRARKWVEITDKDVSVLVELRDFAGDRMSIWRNLADRGVFLIAKYAKNSVSEQVENLEDFPERLIFSGPGWCGGQFANASGQVFAAPKVPRGAIAFTPKLSKCAKEGTANGWKEKVAAPLVGHPIPAFAVMACFAAPMLEIVGRTDNFGFELCGAGGKGKSTTQRLMASVVGPAMEKNRSYIATFNMTPAALEQSMEWHSDMPFIIDEANLFGSSTRGRAGQGAMRDFSFQMASGSTKGRYGMPDQEGYRFIFVTSANEPFHELLDDEHHSTADAATDRLMSITVPEGDAGVFGPLPPGYATYREFTLALEKAMAEEHGSAMPKFLRALVRARYEDEAKLRTQIQKHIATFKRRVGVSDNNGSDARVAEAFGLVYAAGSFAQFHSVLPRAFNCLGAAEHCYANFRSTVPVRQSLPERLLAIADRPETITIDPRNLPTLSKEEMEGAGAFIRPVKGKPILLMTPTFGGQMFPDWDALKGTAEFRSLNKADKDGRGRGYHCQVRANSKVDWFYAFELPDRGTTA